MQNTNGDIFHYLNLQICPLQQSLDKTINLAFITTILDLLFLKFMYMESQNMLCCV